MARKDGRKSLDYDDRLRALNLTKFPDTAPQLTEVQIWQQKKQAEKEARAAYLKTRKPKVSKVGKKSVAIMAELCARVADGESVAQICESLRMPSRASLYEWIHDDVVFADMFKRAYSERGEKFAEETTLLADEAREAPPELTSAYKLAVETRRWVASRLIPKKYGDRVALVGDSENPVAVQHVAASNELLKKIRGVEGE